MSYFITTTMREMKKMSVLRDAYEKQLEELPRGSLQIKKRKDKQYYYLAYRDNDKVVSQYAGNNEKTISYLKEQLERRKGIERLLRSIKKEIAIMNKAMEAAK
jgi:hypothetical protein